jgi:stage V sporulation protein G
MEITSVQIQTAAAKENLRAYADITFDNCFRVVGLRLVVGPNGYELFMPSKKTPRGERVMSAYAITDQMKNRIKAAVIAEYERVTVAAVTNHDKTLQVRAETRHDIEKRMDGLARQYLETHDAEIIRQMNELCRRLDH